MRKKIIGLTYLHENQALGFATESYATMFRAFDWDAITLDLTQADGGPKLQQLLQSGDVAFCYALQGVGSRLALHDGRNIWSYFKTPFLALHHDTPSSNIYNHFCESRYVGNLYLFKSMLDIQQRYIQSDQINAHLDYKIIDIPYPDPLRFADRPVRLCFIKSGKDPASFAATINSITAPLRDAIWAAIVQAERDENLVLCDLLDAAFIACGLDSKDHWNDFWGFADVMENYLRAKRAATIVDWLKKQDGAVIIGAGWDFIDKDGARALFKPAIDSTASMDIYRQSQFILNTSPYGRDIIHERVMLGLCRGAFVISDTNEWWDNHFKTVPSLCRFKYHDDLQAQLGTASADPLAAEKADALIGAERARETVFGATQIPIIAAYADSVRHFAET